MISNFQHICDVTSWIQREGRMYRHLQASDFSHIVGGNSLGRWQNTDHRGESFATASYYGEQEYSGRRRLEGIRAGEQELKEQGK